MSFAKKPGAAAGEARYSPRTHARGASPSHAPGRCSRHRRRSLGPRQALLVRAPAPSQARSTTRAPTYDADAGEGPRSRLARATTTTRIGRWRWRERGLRTCAVTKEDTLVVHEIYANIQGESTFAGLPCIFVRTTGCNLRCVWCDTPQAFYEGYRGCSGPMSLRKRSRLEHRSSS